MNPDDHTHIAHLLDQLCNRITEHHHTLHDCPCIKRDIYEEASQATNYPAWADALLARTEP